MFIDSPAGVGFSQNDDSSYEYNDLDTAKDNLRALKSFLFEKFSEYKTNPFYIAG